MSSRHVFWLLRPLFVDKWWKVFRRTNGKNIERDPSSMIVNKTDITEERDTGSYTHTHTWIAGNKCYYGLSKLLKARMTSRNLKVRLYRNLSSNVWCEYHGCKTWTSLESEHNLFFIFQRKVLRTILGLVEINVRESRRIRKNDESKYQMSDVSGEN